MKFIIFDPKTDVMHQLTAISLFHGMIQIFQILKDLEYDSQNVIFAMGPDGKCIQEC